MADNERQSVRSKGHASTLISLSDKNTDSEIQSHTSLPDKDFWSTEKRVLCVTFEYTFLLPKTKREKITQF